jgi:hypothetical protein
MVRIVGKRLLVKNVDLRTNATVSLFDVSGKRVAMQSGKGEIGMDLSYVAKGVYFVKTEEAAGTWAEKIVVGK